MISDILLVPFDEIEIPICMDETWYQNDSRKMCSEYLIQELELDQDKHCKKPCHVKEYNYEVDRKRDEYYDGNELMI